jgi:hypothetical protein
VSAIVSDSCSVDALCERSEHKLNMRERFSVRADDTLILRRGGVAVDDDDDESFDAFPDTFEADDTDGDDDRDDESDFLFRLKRIKLFFDDILFSRFVFFFFSPLSQPLILRIFTR